jgi:hypothetical protein
MNTAQLLDKVSTYYNCEYNAAQVEEILSRISYYNSEQLKIIYNGLIDNCKFRPLVADFKKITSVLYQDLQAVRLQAEQRPIDYSCQLCGGRGSFRIPAERAGEMYPLAIVCSCPAGIPQMRDGRLRYNGIDPLPNGERANQLRNNGAIDCYDDYIGLYWREVIA